MDLSFPLATVAPTLDAGVLQVLSATTAECTAAEVHRRLGRGSDEGIRKVLARLAAQGVVLTETPARYPVYWLNRDHVAAPHIEALAMVRVEIVRRISEEVGGWSVQPRHASLFGSFARGTATAESDVDVAVVRPEAWSEGDETSWLKQIDHLDQHISRWTGNAAQIIDLAPDTLASMVRSGDALIDSWRVDGIHLCGERILDLLRTLR